MPRGVPSKDGFGGTGARHRLARAVDPFSSGAHVDSCDRWDSRSEEVTAVILGLLSRGQAVMFGVSRDGGTISIGVNVGEKQWSRKYVHDEGEWIAVIHEMAVRIAEDSQREAAD